MESVVKVMKYITKKLPNDIYIVLDTDTNTSTKYSYSDLKKLNEKGVYIRGVAYIEGELVASPVILLYSISKSLMVKNKMLTGKVTGVDGFDLKFEDDKVIALPLDLSFYEFVRENKTGNKFVFVIPDGVTELSHGFISGGFDTDEDISIYLDLPDSLKKIGSRALCFDKQTDAKILDIGFNGILDRIYGKVSSADGDYNFCSLMVWDESKEETYKIKARVLDSYAIEFDSIAHLGKKRINIDLPYTERIDLCSIIAGFNMTNLYLGKSITSVSPFAYPMMNSIDESEDVIMRYSHIVYVPDNCNLRLISFNMNSSLFKYVNESEDEDDIYTSYIAVMSENEYKDLCNKYSCESLKVYRDNPCCWIGVLTYKTDEELKSIESNIKQYLSEPERYFSRYLTSKDFGKFTKLELRERL